MCLDKDIKTKTFVVFPRQKVQKRHVTKTIFFIFYYYHYYKLLILRLSN
jgi:hypothetical protein